MDLVAQYALLTHYSHYDEYFRKFTRNNGQIGASFQIRSLPAVQLTLRSLAPRRISSTARGDAAARNRIMLTFIRATPKSRRPAWRPGLRRQSWISARSQLSVVLAQMNEGRAALRQVEDARFNENEKWIAFYDAQFNAEKARLAVLRQTGDLLAALK